MHGSLDGIRQGAGLPERVATRIHLLLASTPDPESAARYLECMRQESPSAFDRVASSPAALRCAVNLFSYSRFLSEAVLQRPERILQVANSGSFYRVLTVEEYGLRLIESLGREHGGAPTAVDLARFRRRQLLRIVLRDVLSVATLSDIAEEISNLVERRHMQAETDKSL